MLSGPLETQKDAPSGRIGMAEGGRTAPIVGLTAFDVLPPLTQCVGLLQLRISPRAILDSDWAEDRATVGTDLSADPVAETGDGAAHVAPLLFRSPGSAPKR